MKEEAKRICQEERGYWAIYRRLVRLGVDSHRARQMARRAAKNEFLWDGVVESLDVEE